MGFFSEMKDYAEAKNKLNEILNSSKSINELELQRKEYHNWVFDPYNLTNLDAEDKNKIIKESDNEIDRKIKALSLEKSFNNFFS